MHQWLKSHYIRSAGSRSALSMALWILLLLWPLLWAMPSGIQAAGAVAETVTVSATKKTAAPAGTLKIFADEIRYDPEGREVSARGNVKLIYGMDILIGDSLTLNLDTETGVLHNGVIFLKENHLYLSADEIVKTGPDSYRASRATITACDGPAPDWRITGKEVRVTIEGYGIAKHAAFWAKGLPLAYSPYLVFPVKTKRQTGFLAPELVYSENRQGVQYRQPFYWAINDSSDTTLYADIMSLRGVRLGAEYRYAIQPDAYGAIMVGGFNDNKVDGDTEESGEVWGYADDAYLRTNHDRYWLRAKANQNLPWGVAAKLDLDLVSDQDYLHEFRKGSFGFKEARSYFRETFGRDLEDEYDLIRRNQLNLNKTWQGFALNGDIRWYDDIIQRRQEENQDTIQNLPALSFSAVQQQLITLPIYYRLDAQYDHFYRADDANGHRTDLYAGLVYPLRLFETLQMETSAGLRQTLWFTDPDDAASNSAEDPAHRSLYNFKIDINSEPYRVYQSDLANGDRLKHIIKPQLIYEYVSDQDQDDLPYFDFQDRIAAKNTLTFAITNTLITRQGRTAAPRSGASEPGDPKPGIPDTEGAGALTSYFYRPFLRFKLAESFDIQKHTADDPEPFSDILGELDLTPGQFISIDANTLWSPYDGVFTSYNAGVHLWDSRGDRLDISYRYTRATGQQAADDTQSMNLEGRWRLTDHWRLRANHERNLAAGTAIETGVEISYLSQCWAVTMEYTQEPEDRSLAMVVRLAGLGKISDLTLKMD